MSYSSSEPEAQDLGFTLPKGTDLIREGDNAITTNALVATGALRAAFNRLRTLEDAPPPITDHGNLTGLADDDHPQYLTNARGDGRYSPLGHAHSWAEVTDKPTAFPPSAHVHTTTEVTGLQSALDGKANTAHTHTAAAVGAVPADDPRLRDTGWRDVTSLADPAVFDFTTDVAGGSYLRWRRIGSTVHLAVRAPLAEGTIGTNAANRRNGLIGSLPALGAPANAYIAAGYVDIASAIMCSLTNSSTSARLDVQPITAAGTISASITARSVGGNVSWLTDASWPSTLPGTPA